LNIIAALDEVSAAIPGDAPRRQERFASLAGGEILKPV